MKVKILVTADATFNCPKSERPGSDPKELPEQAREAVAIALEHCMNEGFQNSQSDITSIHIDKVVLNSKPRRRASKSTWKCEECGDTVTVSASELARVGTPMCMRNGCDNFEREMTHIGG